MTIFTFTVNTKDFSHELAPVLARYQDVEACAQELCRIHNDIAKFRVP